MVVVPGDSLFNKPSPLLHLHINVIQRTIYHRGRLKMYSFVVLKRHWKVYNIQNNNLCFLDDNYVTKEWW